MRAAVTLDAPETQRRGFGLDEARTHLVGDAAEASSEFPEAAENRLELFFPCVLFSAWLPFL